MHIFIWEQWSLLQATGHPSHGLENCPEGLLLQPFCAPGDGLRKARAAESGCSCCGSWVGAVVTCSFLISAKPSFLFYSPPHPFCPYSPLVHGLYYWKMQITPKKIAFFISLLKNRGHSCANAEIKVAKKPEVRCDLCASPEAEGSREAMREELGSQGPSCP